MKTAVLFFLSFGLIYPAIADGYPGLYLRAVVDDNTSNAVQITGKEGQTVLISNDAILTPDDVKSAAVEDGEKVMIRFEFNEAGQKKLGAATRAMIGEKLAIVIDGVLVSTPVVQSEFSTGASITGNFTREWAEGVVERVNKGPKG